MKGQDSNDARMTHYFRDLLSNNANGSALARILHDPVGKVTSNIGSHKEVEVLQSIVAAVGGSYAAPVTVPLSSTGDFENACRLLYAIAPVSIKMTVRAYFVHGIRIWKPLATAVREIADVLFIVRYLIETAPRNFREIASRANLAQMKAAEQSGNDFHVELAQLDFYLLPLPFVLGRPARPRGTRWREVFDPLEWYAQGEYFFYWLVSRKDLSASPRPPEYRWHLTPNVALPDHSLTQNPRSRFVTISGVQALLKGTGAIRSQDPELLRISSGESPFLTGVAFQLHGVDCFPIERLYREAVRRKLELARRMEGGLLVVDLAVGATGQGGTLVELDNPPALPQPPADEHD